MPANAPVIQVALPRPLRRTFDYAPPENGPVPKPGARVRVPFGNTSVVGLVTGTTTTSAHELKPVEQTLDAEALLPEDLVELAHWLAGYYHHPVGDVIKTLLPVKARRGARAVQTEEAVWRPVAQVPDAETLLRRAPKQRAAFDRLGRLGEVADAELAAHGIDRQAAAALAAKGLVDRIPIAPRYQTRASTIEPNPGAGDSRSPRSLNPSGSATTHLLEGVTGSGKTEVYMRVIADVLASGRQALVLVPEIALTPQTTARFTERFGAAATLHSVMTDTQRFDTWLKCASGLHKVLIGTRSAVLTPFADLGAIIVDEEHDGSFKQHEGLRYSARDVAVKRGQALSIPVVLGSATPSLETLENVGRSRYRHLRLPERVADTSLPVYRVVDIRGERLDGGLGAQLQRAIGRHLAAGDQVLVFINRRGYAPVLLVLALRLAGPVRPLRRETHLPPHPSPVALPPLRLAAAAAPANVPSAQAANWWWWEPGRSAPRRRWRPGIRTFPYTASTGTRPAARDAWKQVSPPSRTADPRSSSVRRCSPRAITCPASRWWPCWTQTAVSCRPTSAPPSEPHNSSSK